MSYSLEKGLSYGESCSVVLIGTSVYPEDDLLEDIPHVQNNIEALVNLFLDPAVIGLDSQSIEKIVDEPHANVTLTKLRKRAKEAKDTLLVYYAGHGLYGDGECALYLASSNTTDDGKAFDGIPIEKVKKAIAESPAKKKILILDCCYSGTVHEGGMGDDPTDRILDLVGTFIISASSANSTALAPPGEKFTVFTGELIRTLEEGLEGLPNTITLKDIFEAVRSRLQKLPDTPLPESSTWLDGHEFIFAENQIGKEKSVFRVLGAMQVLSERIEEVHNQLEKHKAEVKGKLDEIGETLSNLGSNVEKADISAKRIDRDLRKFLEQYKPTRTFLIVYRFRFFWGAILFACIIFIAFLNFGITG